MELNLLISFSFRRRWEKRIYFLNLIILLWFLYIHKVKLFLNLNNLFFYFSYLGD